MCAALARHHVVASAQEVTSWPHDADHSPELSIGRVVDALKDEFPAISLSKVRYLESEGLVSPARTGSGYRKYSAADVERLRYVLTEQRDSFTPLSVIRAQLAALDAGCVQAVSTIARLESAGVDVRVLRAVRQGAERSADIIDQTVSSQRGRGRGADRERARARAIELGDLFAELHRDMLAVAVSSLAEDGD